MLGSPPPTPDPLPPHQRRRGACTWPRRRKEGRARRVAYSGADLFAPWGVAVHLQAKADEAAAAGSKSGGFTRAGQRHHRPEAAWQLQPVEIVRLFARVAAAVRHSAKKLPKMSQDKK